MDDSKYIVTNTTQLRLKHPDLDSYVEISIKQRKTPIMSIPHHLASKTQKDMQRLLSTKIPKSGPNKALSVIMNALS